MIDPDVLKIIVLLALFILTFLLGIIPLRLIRRNSESGEYVHLVAEDNPRANLARVISFLSCFAAGVFLATCLLDLLPIVRRVFMNVLDQMKIATGFPVAEFVMVLGLFSILTTEQVVLKVREGTRKDGHGMSQGVPAQIKGERGGREKGEQKLHEGSTLDGQGNDQSSAQYDGQNCQTIRECNGHLDDHRQSNNYSETSFSFDVSESVKSTARSEVQEQQNPHSTLRAVFLLFSLSLHSVFEGLAIGLQKKDMDVLDIFAALLIHKCILSFSLGLKLAQTRLATKSVACSVLFFSVTAPIGVGMGTGIVSLSSSNTSLLVQGVLQGLACGTFLYITFFEVLPNEFNTHENRILKLAFVFLGYCLVTGLLFLGDDVWIPFCAAPPRDGN